MILRNFIKFLLFNRFFQFFWNSKLSLDEDYNFQLLKVQNNKLLKKLYFSEFINIKNKLNHKYLYHSFNWIEIGKNIGGSENILKTKNIIIEWQKKKFSFFSFAWNFNLTAQRLINLIYNYDFYSQNLYRVENKMLNKLIKIHKAILSFEYNFFRINDADFVGLKAILLINLINQKNISNVEKSIIKNIRIYFNHNGSHKSYNTTIQLVALNNLIEIKNMFLFYKIEYSEILDFSIFKAGCYLASMFHNDNTLALFHGSNNFYLNETKILLKKIDNIKKYSSTNISEGIGIYHDSKKTVFFDTVSPGKYYEKNNLHASTLAIEISFNKEKIFTNCGSLETGIGNKPDYLKYSAAHSTIILDNTNLSEIKGTGSFKKYPRIVKMNQIEDDNYFIMEGVHDAYSSKYGLLTKRKIKIKKSSNEVIGEDTLLSQKLIGKNKLTYSIRFHLSPECTCSLTNNKKNIIIKSKKQSVYIFESNRELSIEDSIFIVDGIKTNQNKQIVINNIVKSIKETNHWTLRLV